MTTLPGQKWYPAVPARASETQRVTGGPAGRENFLKKSSAEGAFGASGRGRRRRAPRTRIPFETWVRGLLLVEESTDEL